jgi:hypothetical protein
MYASLMRSAEGGRLGAPAEPGGDVVDDGADHAGGKRRPDHAKQHRGVRALYQMPVYEMSHGGVTPCATY